MRDVLPASGSLSLLTAGGEADIVQAAVRFALWTVSCGLWRVDAACREGWEWV